MTKTLSPPTKPPRVSVPVDAEVLAVFERLAKSGNLSTGRAIAQWLADTVEAAEFMASTMERARESPKIVVRELQAYTLGLTDELSSVMEVIQRKGDEARRGALVEGTRLRGVADEAQSGPIPPSCNTGGKVPKPQVRPMGGNSGFPLPPAKVQAYADTNGKPPKAPK